MNILIISENFLKGGLETYLYTIYNKLKNKNNIYFCLGNFNSDLDIDKKSIITDFNFSPNASVSQFCGDVDKLTKVIYDKKIDLMIVNPFYSLFPAVFAANITNTKMIYLYHGMGSLNFPNNAVDSILFRYAFETTVNKAFCVTQQGVEAFKSIGFNDSIFLPNPLDEKLYESTIIQQNKKWALISRLDYDKLQDVTNFLKILPYLDIEKIDIYGDGTEKNFIEEYILNNNLVSKIELKGYSAQIYKEIKDKYTGVIGIGRVTIEGLAMNYPVFLIGYNKIVGVINKNLYKKLYQFNFVPNYCDSLSLNDIQKQINNINKGKLIDYQFRDQIIKDFGIKNFVKTLKTEVELKEFHNRQNIVNLYASINNLLVNDNKNEIFYLSLEVFNLLKKHIAGYTNDFNIKTSFIIFDQLFSNRFLSNELEEKFKLLSKNLEKNIEIIKHANVLIKEIEKTKNNINDIYNSTSWKITKPLRQLKILGQKVNIDRNKNNER